MEHSSGIHKPEVLSGQRRWQFYSEKMKTIALVLVFALAVVCIEGRAYYGKRPVKPIQRCPQIGCPFIYIEPGCRRETYTWHNGIRCPGCPEDICNNWQNGHLNDWQQGGNFLPRRNNWRLRQNWQNQQFW